MKRIALGLVFLFLAINSTIASSNTTLPDDVSVREHWVSLTKSYDIETRSEKLGTLYRRFFSLLLTYDFYDPMDNKTATAQARFFSLGAYLDIYDQKNQLIGGVEEKIFNFFPTFEILARNSSTKLARAEMNFWGTKFYIYDPVTNEEMAIMSRPYFRFKNDWKIHVTNRALLEHKNIDSRVLLTVLAVQGEIEDWQKDHSDDNHLKTAESNPQADQSTALLEQINALNTKSSLTTLEKPSDEVLEQLADEIDQGFNTANQSNDTQTQSNEERIQAFTEYCINLLNSENVPDSKKQAVRMLLNMRLQGHI